MLHFYEYWKKSATLNETINPSKGNLEKVFYIKSVLVDPNCRLH